MSYLIKDKKACATQGRGSTMRTKKDLLEFIWNLRDLARAGQFDEVVAEVVGDFCANLIGDTEIESWASER